MAVYQTKDGTRPDLAWRITNSIFLCTPHGQYRRDYLRSGKSLRNFLKMKKKQTKHCKTNKQIQGRKWF